MKYPDSVHFLLIKKLGLNKFNMMHQRKKQQEKDIKSTTKTKNYRYMSERKKGHFITTSEYE
ncbi:hypothetical protein DERF_006019 [Dermatophagoides farinae]|uniref:Uncharacterized protein n=1 Tax=Dermatophagoides farinae TaxID=6954 RepID=A0A922I859_DERFA|nr:hypothetical protein DERF_006019 [Dermatophagoides farinae]